MQTPAIPQWRVHPGADLPIYCHTLHYNSFEDVMENHERLAIQIDVH